MTRLSQRALVLLGATASICNARWDTQAQQLVVADLESQDIDEDRLVVALERCRRELTHPLTLAHILERLPPPPRPREARPALPPHFVPPPPDAMEALKRLGWGQGEQDRGSEPTRIGKTERRPE